jgi:hypothetical protein
MDNKLHLKILGVRLALLILFLMVLGIAFPNANIVNPLKPTVSVSSEIMEVNNDTDVETEEVSFDFN